MTEEPISASKSGDTYSAEITNIEFEWENLSDQFQELIYQGEQELPEIISNLKVTKDPEKDENFWTYSEQIIWTEYEGVNEFYISPGSEVFFRKSKSGAKLTVSEKNWPSAGGSVLIKSPLVYRDFQVDSFEESDRQVRNYCTAYTINADTSAATEPEEEEMEEEETAPEPEEELEAAPEEEMEEEETIPEPEEELEAAGPAITSDQTQTPTGTEHVVLVVLAAIAGLIFVRKKRLS